MYKNYKLPSPADDNGAGNVGDMIAPDESTASDVVGGDRMEPNVEAVKLANCKLKPVGIIRPTPYPTLPG